MSILEDYLEQSVLELLQELGYGYECGYDIAPTPDGPRPERDSHQRVWLLGRLRKQLAHLNPHLPPSAIEDAIARLHNLEGGLTKRNSQFHRYLRDGVPIEYSNADGEPVGDLARVADFDNALNNDWLCVKLYRHNGSRKTPIMAV
jgi:type I restriction enzyme R subunit